MTPVSSTPQRAFANASPELLLAANIVRDAADELAEATLDASESARYRVAADRLAAVLGSPRVGRLRLLGASPALTERSGRNRTLVEMIGEDPGEIDARVRLAKLLLRALRWRPETMPQPTG
jgi:hypothetical protein